MPWLDGTPHENGIVSFNLADRGLLLGDGVFDTSLILKGKMVWRSAHVARLEAACQILGFSVDPTRIEVAIDGVLEGVNHASLRITVTRGSGPRGLAPPKDPKPTIFAAVAPLRTEALCAPIKLARNEIRRNETSPASRTKSLSYIDSVLAMRDAILSGCDDALFLNTRENVACTAIGNVFALIGDQLITPPLEDGVVAGIVRATVLQTCDDLGLEGIERTLTPGELDRADAVIMTNSLRLVAPVTAIGKAHLGSSSSRLTQALIAHVASLVCDETGVDPRRLAER